MGKELWEIFKLLRQKHPNWHGVMHEMERLIVTEAVDEFKGKTSQAIATKLGLQRTTFVMKKRRLNIKPTP